jgi:AraC family transcriptional regulator
MPLPAPRVATEVRHMSTDWANYRDFYANGPYAPYLREERVGGSAPVQLLEVGQPSGDWSDPAVPDLIVIQNMTERSRVHCDLGGGRFSARMPKGAFNFVPPNTSTDIVLDNAHELRVCAIPEAYIIPLLAGVRPAGDLFDFGHLHTGYLRSEVMNTLLDRMWELAACGIPASRLAMDGAVLTMLSELFSAADRPNLAERGGLAPWQLRWVNEHMEAHLGDDVTLSTLAALVDLSPNHFCTAYKTSTGEPPHRALIRMRVERAKRMLAQRHRSITEIALELGFGSSAHFATAFRKHTALTPSEWRRTRSVVAFPRPG